MKIGNFDQIDLSRCNKPLMVLHETNVLDLFALPRTSNSIISTCFFLYFRLRRIRPASTFISECLQPIKRYNAALRLSSHPQMYTHTSLHHHQRGQADLSLKLNLSHVVSYTNFYDPQSPMISRCCQHVTLPFYHCCLHFIHCFDLCLDRAHFLVDSGGHPIPSLHFVDVVCRYLSGKMQRGSQQSQAQSRGITPQNLQKIQHLNYQYYPHFDNCFYQSISFLVE